MFVSSTDNGRSLFHFLSSQTNEDILMKSLNCNFILATMLKHAEHEYIRLGYCSQMSRSRGACREMLAAVLRLAD